jgi:ribonuclease HI
VPSAAFEADIQEVERRERALLDPAVRRDPERVAALLAVEFLEFGGSGRVFSRADVVAAAASQGLPIDEAEVSELAARTLAGDLVLLTYRLVTPRRTTLRSSLWRRDGDGAWRLLFHQGTPVVEGA